VIEVQSGSPNSQVTEVVFFPFDDVSVPFSADLRLQLVSGKAKGERTPIVLGRGEPGQPDDAVVRFYGTVIPSGNILHMWYLARGQRDARGLRVCYATSSDGMHWEKPTLGLVDYHGNAQNNIVDLRAGHCDLAALPIIVDPDDPDPNRRFKCVFESAGYGNQLAVAYSADGLRWTESPRNPVGPMLEQAGLIKWRGCYFVNGQGGSHFGSPGGTRKLATFASYDFEHWTAAACLGFRRDTLPPRPMIQEWNAAEEVHLGAGRWDRGNVILGVYGMWHGHPSGDRERVGIDLGLVVSNDALHYREPVPDFRLIPAREETGWPTGREPALGQGQALLNVGDRTFCWYEAWGHGDVRLASWPRDRLGYFAVFRRTVGPHFITCPVRTKHPLKVYANVDGLGEHSSVLVELCDEQFQPLPGYSGADCVPLQTPGLRQHIRWRGHETITGVEEPVRLRVSFCGLRPEDIKLFAIYISAADEARQSCHT
jgi:hypothetical protein